MNLARDYGIQRIRVYMDSGFGLGVRQRVCAYGRFPRALRQLGAQGCRKALELGPVEVVVTTTMMLASAEIAERAVEIMRLTGFTTTSRCQGAEDERNGAPPTPVFGRILRLLPAGPEKREGGRSRPLDDRSISVLALQLERAFLRLRVQPRQLRPLPQPGRSGSR